MAKIDFLTHKHPVLAVACPSCRATVGHWCKRPSGHKATELHADRGTLADKTFVELHGERASIDRLPDGQWRIDPEGYVSEKSIGGS